MEILFLLIPISPLLGFIVNIIFGRFLGGRFVNAVALSSIALSTIISIIAVTQVLSGKTFEYNLYTWIISDDLKVTFGYVIDQLTAVMLIVVTSVSLLVHIYSIGYMHGDPGYSRYFAYLNLFVFSMLMLVMGNNLLQLYFGWEAVGLCSYFLIGFWYKKKSAADAGKKAFIVNRVGDFGFALGIFLLFINVQSLNYFEIFPKLPLLKGLTFDVLGLQLDLITVIALLLFCGAVGKSAQLPLHVWLPDAMEGPTPVSALIHAATMVTAGVFMIARLNPLFGMSETALAVVAFIGAITSFMAATIGLVQRDIKRIVAYSTISQLGYMFLACGLAAYGAGIFHLYTHAFFKALLFLCAGSVMHAMAGELDIYKMGGLKKYMPITYKTFLIAALTISGVPFLSGFYSKDQILWFAYASAAPYGKFLWSLGTVTAALTAFYTFRVLFVAFHGRFRGDEKTLKHLHEAPKVMTIPLIILAVLSIIGGYFSVPSFLEPVVGKGIEAVPHSEEKIVMVTSILAGLIGIFLAWYVYVKKPQIAESAYNEFSQVYNVLWNKYYFDELYDRVFVRPTIRLSQTFIEAFTDKRIIEGIVNGVPKLLYWSGSKIRNIQTGYLQHYAVLMILGICLIMFIIFSS